RASFRRSENRMSGPGAAKSRPVAESLTHAVEHQLDLFGGDAEMGREAQRVGTTVDHADSMDPQILLELTVADDLEHLRVDLARDQEPGALDLGHDVRKLVAELAKTLEELGAAGRNVAANLRSHQVEYGTRHVEGSGIR